MCRFSAHLLLLLLLLFWGFKKEKKNEKLNITKSYNYRDYYFKIEDIERDIGTKIYLFFYQNILGGFVCVRERYIVSIQCQW